MFYIIGSFSPKVVEYFNCDSRSEAKEKFIATNKVSPDYCFSLDYSKVKSKFESELLVELTEDAKGGIDGKNLPYAVVTRFINSDEKLRSRHETIANELDNVSTYLMDARIGKGKVTMRGFQKFYANFLKPVTESLMYIKESTELKGNSEYSVYLMVKLFLDVKRSIAQITDSDINSVKIMYNDLINGKFNETNIKNFCDTIYKFVTYIFTSYTLLSMDLSIKNGNNFSATDNDDMVDVINEICKLNNTIASGRVDYGNPMINPSLKNFLIKNSGANLMTEYQSKMVNRGEKENLLSAPSLPFRFNFIV